MIQRRTPSCQDRHCWTCHKVDSAESRHKLCGRCRTGMYCCKHCQVDDWHKKRQGMLPAVSHKSICPLISAVVVEQRRALSFRYQDALQVFASSSYSCRLRSLDLSGNVLVTDSTLAVISIYCVELTQLRICQCRVSVQGLTRFLEGAHNLTCLGACGLKPKEIRSEVADVVRTYIGRCDRPLASSCALDVQ